MRSLCAMRIPKRVSVENSVRSISRSTENRLNYQIYDIKSSTSYSIFNEFFNLFSQNSLINK